MISIVVPVFNEEHALPAFLESLFQQCSSLNEKFEILVIDDGSYDQSTSIIKQFMQSSDLEIIFIKLSRNFGHEAAMLAGLEHALGDAVICMDADLQHPPAYLQKMIDAHRGGNEIILMKSTGSYGSGLARRFYGSMFYRFFSIFTKEHFESNVSDFFLISARVKDILVTRFHERNRFMRGYLQSIGFQKIILEYTPAPRTAGKSKYKMIKLLELSWNAFTGFSTIPLKASLPIGLIVGGLSILLLLYSLAMYLIGKTIDGYTTIVALVCLLFSYLAICLGIFGHYLAVLIEEVKKRPTYIIETTIRK